MESKSTTTDHCFHLVSQQHMDSVNSLTTFVFKQINNYIHVGHWDDYHNQTRPVSGKLAASGSFNATFYIVSHRVNMLIILQYKTGSGHCLSRVKADFNRFLQWLDKDTKCQLKKYLFGLVFLHILLSNV